MHLPRFSPRISSVAGVLESPTTCHFEGGSGRLDFKVNGYGVPEEDSRLDLFITLFYPQKEIRKITSVEIDRAFRRLLRFVGAALTSDFRKHLEPGSDPYAMVLEIFAKRDQYDRIRLYLLTNGIVSARKEAERVGSFKDYKLSYEIWDLERIRRLRSSGVAQEPIAVNVTQFGSDGISCVSVADETLGYKTCAALFPGKLLHDLYDEHGARLLELNVRSYLQARGKINKGILATLVREPHRFLAYNNGITIVAEEIEFGEGGTSIRSIRGMQIVNGGQTTASIHRACKENKVDLSRVYVQAKLTVVPPSEFEEMVPQISRYSNTQNKVSEVDLRANNAYHVGIERMSRRIWAPGEQSKWFYERARGSYQTDRAKIGVSTAARQKFDQEYPSTKRFTKEDLARYVNTWMGLPYLVSRGGQKNFVRFMESVPAVLKGWEMPADEFKELVGKAILFRETQTIAREQGIPSFRIQIVNYTVSLVAEVTARRINLLKIWESQSLSPALRKLVAEWLKRVGTVLTESVGNRNPTEWFKSDQCWKHLRDAAHDWVLPEPVKDAARQSGDVWADDHACS